MGRVAATETGDVTLEAPRVLTAADREIGDVAVAASPPAARWRVAYPSALAASDCLMALVAGIVAALVRTNDASAAHGWLATAGAVVPLVWVALLGLGGGYRLGRIGLGADEYKCVFNAALWLAALSCFAGFVLRLPVSREYVAVALPTATLLTLLGRYAGRKTVHRLRRMGRCSHAVIAVGSPDSTAALERQLHRDYNAGLAVVAATELTTTDDFDALFGMLTSFGADTVAVTSSVDHELLRRLGWQLEGRGVALLVAPALTDIAGPRISIRPVSGLPLLEVEEPNLRGARQVVKALIDRVVSVVGLLVLAPVLVLIAAVIRVTSDGPALFTQQRLGRGARPFTIYKFRTMYDGADKRFSELVEAQSDNTGGMFVKAPGDSRVTPVGRWLRRFSIDELPQLINVLRGDMSLVGPRPLPVEVLQIGPDVRRRLLVRPGITGLWQVSGRSDLPWDEAVRIDLYYVENWSLSFDVMILWKTLFVALRGTGAY